jgi:hypothetical protein
MPVNPYLGGAAFVASFLLVLLSLSAQGAPTTPFVTSPTQLNPSAAQEVSFTITSKFYSLQSPNTVDQPGTRATYSVWAGSTNLVSNASIPMSAGATASGGAYVL